MLIIIIIKLITPLISLDVARMFSVELHGVDVKLCGVGLIEIDWVIMSLFPKTCFGIIPIPDSLIVGLF